MLGAISTLILTPLYTIYKILSIDDFNSYFINSKKLILISDVIKELNNKNIVIEDIRYIGDVYGQFKSKYIDYPFRKLEIEDFINTTFYTNNSLLMCSIIPNRVKFCNVSMKITNYKKMLKQLGVKV